jgi:CSLREA domain-containing protein
MEERTLLSVTITVNTNSDVDFAQSDGSSISLREAIEISNANTDGNPTGALSSPTALTASELAQVQVNAADTGPNTIRFNIPGPGVQTINVASTGMQVTASVVIDGYSQPGASRNTQLFGDNAVLLIQLSGPGETTGTTALALVANNVTVDGLVVNGFQVGIDDGSGTGDRIMGNFIGTDAGGTVAVPNEFGVQGSQPTIGSPAVEDRNVISGNQLGVHVGSGVVSGNYIGTDASGEHKIPNGAFPNGGIFDYLSGGIIAGGATIGGVNTFDPNTGQLLTFAGNVVSGNTTGILGGNGPQNHIEGNLIGTDAKGELALGNTTGIGESSNESPVGDTVGGTTPGMGNVISGNGTGVGVNGSGYLYEGNLIGTDVTGTKSLGNSMGFYFENTYLFGNTIGGSTAGAGNVISGNDTGVWSGDDNLIEGNLIGLDKSGMASVANGVGLRPGIGNTIGGTTAGARNVIAGNSGGGIYVVSGAPDAPITGNLIEGNYLGTNINGTAAPAGGGTGSVGLWDYVNGNTVGGTAAGAGNVISGNSNDGLVLAGGIGNHDNLIEGNLVGTDPTGILAVGNGGNGISDNNTGNNTIGGADIIDPTTGDILVRKGNVIAANMAGAGGTGNGIVIGYPSGFNTVTGVVVEGNLIGTDVTGQRPLGNTAGLSFWGGLAIAQNTIGGINSHDSAGHLVLAGNVIAANTGYGVVLQGESDNVFEGNLIGTGILGAPLGNGGGIYLGAASLDNIIGSTVAGAANTIANSTTYGGVYLDGNPGPPAPSGDSIEGNSIYGNAGLGIDLVGYVPGPNGTHTGQSSSEANDWQDYPVIAAARSGSSTEVAGTLHGTPNTTYTLDFYANINSSGQTDPAGYGQGETWIGSAQVSTGPNGNAVFNSSNFATPLGATQPGQSLTATATSPPLTPTSAPDSGDTSEFCPAFVPSQASPTAIAVTTSTTSAVRGESVTLTATVTPYFPADASSLSGTVTFFVGGTQVGNPVGVQAAGAGVYTAALAIPANPIGTYAITADYSGDAVFAASTSAPTTLVVGPPPLPWRLTVNTTVDHNDPSAPTLSLREAIELSNGILSIASLSPQAQAQITSTTGGTNIIDFNIPWNDPGHVYYRDDGMAGQITTADVVPVPTLAADGVTPITSDAQLADPNVMGATNTIDPDWVHSWWTIRPAIPTGQDRDFGQLPEITQPVIIDGYSQPGAIRNNETVGDNAILRVALDGTGLGGNYSSNARGGEPEGLALGANDCTVEGLVLDGWAGLAVVMSTERNAIAGNFIGTDVSGTVAQGNAYGIGCGPGSEDDVIGDQGNDQNAGRNLISGQFQAGIWMGYDGVFAHNVITGNDIGTDRTGTAPLRPGFGLAGNGYGVLIIPSAQDTQIGGPGDLANTIAFNQGPGVWIAQKFTYAGPPVPQGNRILGNSIYDNGTFLSQANGLDIDFGGNFDHTVSAWPLASGFGPAPAYGNTSPDPSEPNAFEPIPLLTSAEPSAGRTIITGTVQGGPNATLRLEFFANQATNPAGDGGGEEFLGSAQVTTDASGNLLGSPDGSATVRTDKSGNATFSVSLPTIDPVRPFLAATATDLGTGNTSEFSPGFRLDEPTAHITQPTVSGNSVGFTLTTDPVGGGSAQFTYTVNWGDGAITTPGRSSGGAVLVSHSYAQAGIYAVEVTAQNGNGAVSQTARAAVVLSGTRGDHITVQGGPAAGTVFVLSSSLGASPIFRGLDQIVVSGKGGADAFVVNLGPSFTTPRALAPGNLAGSILYGSNLTTPVTIAGSGNASGDTLALNAAPGDNSVTASGSQVTAGAETVAVSTALAGLTIRGGSGNTWITVSSLAIPVGSLTLNAGSGSNTFDLVNTGSEVGAMAIDGFGSGPMETIVQGPLPATVNVQRPVPVVSLGPDVAIDEWSPWTATGRLLGMVPSQTYTTKVDYQDGAGYQPLVLNSDGSFTLSHTFPSSGTHNVTVEVDDQAGVGLGVLVANVRPSVYVLDPRAASALSLSGSSALQVPGQVVVDSGAANAVSVSGTTFLQAAGIQVVGGVQASNNATITPRPTTGIAPLADPLAGLTPPSVDGLPNYGAVNLNTGSLTLQPGLYSQITVAGSASVSLRPGPYILEGGGLSVTGGANLTGYGVLIYNAGSNYPNSGGNFGGITLKSSGTITLGGSAGNYMGVVIFQSRQNTRALALGSKALSGLGGTIYAPSALLSLGSPGPVPQGLVVDMLNVSTGAAQTQTVVGSDGSGDLAGLANTLLAGNLNVYLNDPAGALTADELARIQDAINTWDALLAPYSVTISQVSDPSLANIVLDTGTASACGGMAQGVLGCYNADASEITMIQGWDWYAGADPTQIGAGQYDFETTVLHELGHALGLGGSDDTSSPMDETLPAGTVRRLVSAPDLNIPEAPDAADPLTAADPQRLTSSQNLPTAPEGARPQPAGSLSGVSREPEVVAPVIAGPLVTADIARVVVVPSSHHHGAHSRHAIVHRIRHTAHPEGPRSLVASAVVRTARARALHGTEG